MAANTMAAIVRFFKDCRLYGCSASVRAVAVPRCCCRIFPAMPAVLACPVIGAGLKVCGNEGFAVKNDGGKITLSPSFVFKIMSFRNCRGQDCR